MVLKKWAGLAVLMVTAFAAFVAALSTGASEPGWREVLPALFRPEHPGHAVLMGIRMPRVIMAVLVGSGLSIAGSVYQTILRNPLASPYTLGIGSSAGFGAVLAIMFVKSSPLRDTVVAASAFGFTVLSSCLIIAVSQLKRAGSETMILTGVALMFLFSALTSFLQYMGTMDQMAEIVFWFFGSLNKAGWPEITVASLMIIVPLPFVIRLAIDFNLMAAGDDTARGLGVNVGRIRITAVILASLITAGSICFTGVIGFVGLVAPHITRMLVGSDNRFLIPASVFFGAALVLVADTLGRTVWEIGRAHV
jgi:iron complex transport system permease protein